MDVTFLVVYQQILQIGHLVKILNVFVFVWLSIELHILLQQNLVLEALIDKTSLSGIAIHDLFGVKAHQCVEKGIKFIVRIVFSPHDPAHSLDFLPPRLEVHTHLDGHVGTRQVDSRISNPAEKYYVNFIGSFE